MEDKEMIRQIQRGNKELLNDVIKKYYDEILRFCIYQLKDVTNSYDITQETFYRFIRSVDTYCYRNLKAYLLAIARNLCVDYWKGNIVMDSLEEREEVSEKRDSFEQVESKMVLAELLSKIPGEQREVIIMRYYNDLKLKDISEISGVNMSTVKSRLRLGIKNLKKQCSGIVDDME